MGDSPIFPKQREVRKFGNVPTGIAPEPILLWASVPQRLVRAAGAVPLDPLRDRPLGLREVFKPVLPDALLLQTAEEPLDDLVLFCGLRSDELLGQPIVAAGSADSSTLEDQRVSLRMMGALPLGPFVVVSRYPTHTAPRLAPGKWLCLFLWWVKQRSTVLGDYLTRDTDSKEIRVGHDFHEYPG
ncbi:MAG TPA: hypothetical protein VMW38_01005 [Terriglobia bacterium]|nr:hypothetical protein [Terriglobia bacterium]